MTWQHSIYVEHKAYSQAEESYVEIMQLCKVAHMDKHKYDGSQNGVSQIVYKLCLPDTNMTYKGCGVSRQVQVQQSVAK